MTNTVIIGGGLIGLSTAFHLSESPRSQAQSIHVVEASPELFHCASGLGGGFLAEDWFVPSVAPLGALSFKLHKDLADKYNGSEKWGYSRCTGTSVTRQPQPGLKTNVRGEDWIRHGGSRAAASGTINEFVQGADPAWLTKEAGNKLDIISDEGTVAQVDPKRLCRFLLDICLERGVKLYQPAKVVQVDKDMRDQLSSVRIAMDEGDEVDVPCTRLVITAGAWSPSVFKQLFPNATTSIPITPLAGHSLLIKSPRWLKEYEKNGCHAVFATDTQGFSPEIFSRAGEEIFLAGLNSSTIPLPNLPTDAMTNPSDIEKLRSVAKQMLGMPDQEDDLQILREGLCFRPVTESGTPIISRIEDSCLGDGFSTRGSGEGGVFVSGGHGPWGISQSLGTGKVLSELVEGMATSADIAALAL
ncbi:FAD dependent oxidoreductase-like protein [Venturia nashicola]|uniref:FAD dependent oxidoreductase-like protein n=1 Tax=Venturia nashicola TaxID=86259 RepID=A0A4Z1PQS3_9PEZI|nr:FAD dependent oxidoreductase-like protein [Venturia nashicola]